MSGQRRSAEHQAGPPGDDSVRSLASCWRDAAQSSQPLTSDAADPRWLSGSARPPIDSELVAPSNDGNAKPTRPPDGQGDVLLPRWMVARLCTAVLAAGITVDGAEELVRSYGRLAERTSAAPRLARRIRIYTLGRFSLVNGDQPFPLHGKAPHKPIELLQALIALGGRNVHAELLMGAVWPDDDSANLRSLFDNTMHRLRRILDGGDALLVRDGRVTLNPETCWVDAWTFERLTGQHELGQAPDLALQALHLYQGHFLQRDAPRTWMFGCRERLRRRFHRLVLTEGLRLENAGHLDDAAAFYERGIEIDPVAENLYQRLMRCHTCNGAWSDALCVYRRCREQLAAELGVQPDHTTEEIRRSASCAAGRPTS